MTLTALHDLDSVARVLRQLNVVCPLLLRKDPNFVRAVQEGAEAFRKGDLLHVQLQTRQWLEGAELKAEHSILKVYRHESGPEQQKLQLSREDQNGASSGRLSSIGFILR